ncbi:MAG: rhomboid family intramembrane serine protease [Alphaproteobacteria bacterium]|nr:rhomboid family intramembrane serine protease [Alphaproteobacteria bacterium]
MVFLPLKDDNPLRYIRFQFATVTLILINVVVFMWQFSLGENALNEVVSTAGVVPVSVFGATNLPVWLGELPPEATLFTYMFLHGDWMHLLGNMLFLWVFGDNVEDAMGAISFTLFYLLCGIAAGLAHVFMNVGSEAPLIGASGAVAGVIGAYIMLYPRVWMWSLAFMRIPLKLPAFVVIGAWVATQIFFIATDVEDGTAWWAHIGGLTAGVLLVALFKRPDQPLFAAAR